KDESAKLTPFSPFRVSCFRVSLASLTLISRRAARMHGPTPHPTPQIVWRLGQDSGRLFRIGNLEHADRLAVAPPGTRLGVFDIDVLARQRLTNVGHGARLIA